MKKTFRGAGAVITTVLRDVSISLERGSFTAIVGPSGSGKSTLLTLIGALDHADEGTIRVGEYDLRAADRATLARYRRSEVGFVFQAYNLLRSLSAVENVEATLQFAGLSARGVRQRAMESLEQVGVAEIARKLPSQLSGGQQQRVAIARAIAHRPALILADEPTGNLDRESGERVFGALVELQRSLAMTCVLVTHDTELAARTERIVRMSDGDVLA